VAALAKERATAPERATVELAVSPFRFAPKRKPPGVGRLKGK
jgi:hypothetical protein